MNELELYVDSLDPSISNEEKVRLVQEWKKANRWKEQKIEVSEQVELEEVDLGTVKKKDGVAGADVPSASAAPKDTDSQLENIFSELLVPEDELLKINEKVNSIDLNTSIQTKRTGGKFSQSFDVDIIPYEEQRIQAKKILEEKGLELNEQAIQNQMRELIRQQEEDRYKAREHDKNAPGFFTLDTVKKIASTAGNIFSGSLRGESGLNKIIARTFYGEELDAIEKQYAKDSTEEAKAVNNLIDDSYFGVVKDVGSKILLPQYSQAKEVFENLSGEDVDKLALDIADKTDTYVEDLDKDIFKYKMGVTESFGDAIEQGDFSGYVRALTQATKEAAGSAPYMAVAAVPGGLGIIGVSTAAGGEFKENSEGSKAYNELINLKVTDPDYQSKKQELEEKIRNGQISLQNLAHHTVVGVTNSIFERWSGRLARKFFNTFKNQPKEVFEKNLKQYVLGFVKESGGEGLTEATQTAIEKASNAGIQGKEVDFQEAMQEIYDSAIIGTVSGAGPSGTSNSINILRTGINNKKEKSLVKEAGVSNAVELFEGDIKPQGLDFTSIPNGSVRIDAELDLQVSNGQKTTEEANAVKNRYREVQGAVNQLKPLDISIENQPAMVDLMIEQKNLQQKIKEVDNSSLTKAQSARLSEIDTELGDLITQDKSKKIDVGAKKIAEEIGVGFEAFNTQEDVDSAIATLQEEGGEIDTKNSDNYGTFVVLPDGRRIIILNKETATEDRAFTEGQHETAHAITYETVKNNPEAAIALGQSLLNEIRTNKDINIKPGFQARLDQYIQDADISQADTMEEVMTLVSDGLTDGTIEINENIGVKLGNFIRRALSAMGMKVKFKDGKDVLNFIKDYNRSVHRQKGLSKGLKKTAIEGAEVTITPDAVTETEIKESVAKESKRVEDSQEVQRLYDEQGVSAAMDIIEKFKPITSKIVESRSQAPNFDRQLLTDEIETGKRGILDLVMEYKPESGVPLAAYINKFLPARAIEASQRVLGEEFTTDVTEAKGVVAEEVTEVVEEKPTKLTKPSSLLSAEAVAEITEQVKEKIKGIDPKSMTFKKLGDLAPEVIAREIGIPVKKLTDPRANLSKGDATAIQQFVNKNADKLLRILPEGSVTEAATDDILGTSTGVPTSLLKAFYTKGKRNTRGAGLTPFIKNKNISKADFLEAFGIVEGKKAEGFSATSPKAQSLKGIASLYGKLVTNEVSRSPEVGLKPEAKQRVAAGKAKTMASKRIKEAVDEVENKGAKKFLEKTLSGNLDADQIAREINKIEDIAKVLGIDFTDVVDYLFTNEKRYKELRSKFDVRVGGKNEISSAANAARLKKGYTSLIKGMIPKGKSFSDLLKSMQQAIIDTVGFGDTRITIGGKPLTYKAYGLKSSDGYSKLLTAAFGADVLKGVGTKLGSSENVFAPRNWGQKGFRGKVEKIADSYNNGDITLDEARAQVEDLLTPDKETSIDDVLVANQRAVSDTYVSLINMFAANPTNENFATIIDILESQVNRATGIFKGLIPVTSFSIKPEKGTTKGKTANKRMHNEHLVELFNANKNFLNTLDKLRKGTITKEKAIFDAKVNAASLEQAVISERMRVEKDADGASVRSFADPLTFLGKDAQFQIPIGIRRLPSGRIFTGTNLAEFIAQELSEKQAKIISIASDASLSPEGIIVKNMINNKPTYQGAKKQNAEMMPVSLGYSKASKKQKTNQDIVGELNTLDQALNEGRKIDKPVKKIRVFDFDDTLARSNSKVIVNMPISSIDKDMLDIVARRKFKKEFENLPSRLQGFNSLNESQKLEVLKEVPGGTKEINATQFAEQAATLEAQGATFDFAQFSKVVDGEKGPLFNVAKKIADKRGAEDLFILTARPQDAAGPIKAFMKSLGIDIPLKNITGLGDGTAAAKGRWIAGKAAEGYNDFYFADDAVKNVQAVKDVLSQLDVKRKVQRAIPSTIKQKVKFSKSSLRKTINSSQYKKFRNNIKDRVLYHGGSETINTIRDNNAVWFYLDDAEAAQMWGDGEVYSVKASDIKDMVVLPDLNDVSMFTNHLQEKFNLEQKLYDIRDILKHPKADEMIAEWMDWSSKNDMTYDIGYNLYEKQNVTNGAAVTVLGVIPKNKIQQVSSKSSKKSLRGNQAVKDVLSQIDVKSKAQQVRASKRKTFDTVVNDMIQDSSGIESFKQFSAAKAKTVGRDKGRFDWLTMASSAEDFKGLLYSLLGNGKKGEAQYEFLKTNLIDPYNRAEDSITQAKIAAANDFMALKEQFPGLPKTLETETGVGKFTYQHALRTYMWTQQGMSIPGLSKTDVKKLNNFIKDDAKLQAFADQLISIQKGKPYPKPGKDWLGGNLTTDIIGGINDVNRKEYQQEWQENVDIIFSPENLNKMEAAYGTRWRKSLENTLTRMKAGTNRLGYNDQTSAVLDWVNNSVGAVMFLNTRSALLQTISAVNFINWGDNNIIAAGKAFANQKQFWGDFMTLMNSDYLTQRRNGLKINVSESEIADAVKDSKNKVKSAVAFLLSKGFVLTRYADSFAIASGGATFYRNRMNKYIKEGMSKELATEKAFQDFRLVAEESQQSSSPDKISSQQASAAGRVILNWANTPMQYVRIQKRSLQDLIAGRGDAKTHISRIAYYGVIQNVIFNALQQALFAIGFGDDDDEKKQKSDDKKIARVANGMIDSQLKGLGIAGMGMVAAKNSLMKIYEESGKQRPEYEKAAIEALSFSPAISSKYRKIVGGLKSFSWNMKEIKEKGFSLDNPAYLAGAQIITATTNIPIDRVIKKANNIRGIMSEQSQMWQKVSMALGWSSYDVGLPYYGGWDKPVEPTPAELKRQEIDVMKKDTSTADQTQMLLDLGLDKKQIKSLRYEDARVKKIIELQNKKKKDAGSEK